MSDSVKRERIEELLRKSLLGEGIVNTQFHLFSARSSTSHRVFKPRVLCANNVLLAKSSKYFLDLLSSDINSSDPSLLDLTDDNDVPNNAPIDDYGYGSDSDLDDSNDPVGQVRRTLPASAQSKEKDCDDELSDDDSVNSDMFVMSPEQPSIDEARSVASSETAVQEARRDHKALVNHTAVRLRSLGSRHILVKDTAFQTWYTLLNYLYTDKFCFLPLGSSSPDSQSHESSASSIDEPRCSAKSMYRLAYKVNLDNLRDEAFSYIRSNLTEHNVLTEISSRLVSKHPELLEMELDVLYEHIASPPVVAGFSNVARRIANKELPHGIDIIVGIHARLLKSLALKPLEPPTPCRETNESEAGTLNDEGKGGPLRGFPQTPVPPSMASVPPLPPLTASSVPSLPRGVTDGTQKPASPPSRTPASSSTGSTAPSIVNALTPRSANTTSNVAIPHPAPFSSAPLSNPRETEKIKARNHRESALMYANYAK